MGLLGSSQSGQPRYSGEEHNLQLTQSVFGTTAPIIIGTQRVALKLLFYGGFFAVTTPQGGGKGGGGKSGGQQYNYYADVLGALASGSASGGCRGILSVWDQQGKLENWGGYYGYTIPTGGGTISPLVAGAAPIQHDLGVSKSVTYSVVVNDYGAGGSQTLAGTQQVAFEKITSGTPAAGQYLFNPTTSSYTFSAADAGATVNISYSAVFSLYYFDTTQPAEVPLSPPYTVSTTNQSYFWQDNGVLWIDNGLAAPTTLTEGASSQGYTVSGGGYTFTPDMAGHQVYINYSFTSSDSSVTNTSQLNLTFFGGSLGQTPWSYMQSQYPGSAFGYTGLCYVGANPMALAESAVLPCYNYEVMGLAIFPGGGLDAHPCDALKLLLTDAFLGVGFPVGCIGDWTSAYAYWAANNYLISKCLDTQTSVAEAMSNVIETGNVAPVWSDGKLKLIPYGDASCVGNGYTYTPNTPLPVTLKWSDLLPLSQHEPFQISKKAPQDCWNYVQAQWSNRANDYNNELINEQNDAFIANYGRRVESAQTWDWITSAATASWALRIRLNRQCYLPDTFKFVLSERFSRLEPMDMVIWPTGEAIRITSKEEAGDGKLTFEAENWTYGAGNVTIYPKQPPSSFQPDFSTALPGDAVPIVVQNTAVQSSGILNKIQIAAAGKGSNWGGCNVHVSLDGQSFTDIGPVTSPALIGQLSAALAAASDPDTADTLKVDLTLSQGNAELVTVTQAQADAFVTLCAIVDQATNVAELISYETATLAASKRYNLTYLRRAVYGTQSVAHAAGAWFAFLGPGYRFLDYQFPPNLVGGVLYVKLQSFNLAGAQLQNLAQCAVFTVLLGCGAGTTVDEVYQPSTYTQSTTGSGFTVTSPTSAYDKSFTSAAILDSGDGTSASSASVTYGGFPSVVTTEPVTLFVNYRNQQGAYVDVGGTHGLGGGQASVQVWISGADVANLVNSEIDGFPRSPENGTATWAVPVGTDLSTITVVVSTTWTPGTSSSFPLGPAHIEPVEIWIQ